MESAFPLESDASRRPGFISHSFADVSATTWLTVWTRIHRKKILSRFDKTSNPCQFYAGSACVPALGGGLSCGKGQMRFSSKKFRMNLRRLIGIVSYREDPSMVFHWGKVISVCISAIGAVGVACAAGDVDVDVNGDFRGGSVGAAIAPGWTSDKSPGRTRVVASRDWDEFGLEIVSTGKESKTVYSDLYAVAGKTLKLEVALRGTGKATVGFWAYDQSRKQLNNAGQSKTYSLIPTDRETKNYFSLTDPKVKFVRIFLSAHSGAKAVFEDVDAEFKTSYPPRTALQSAKSFDDAVDSAVSSLKKTAKVAALPPLIHDKYYAFGALPNKTELRASMTPGSEIEFELGENGASNKYWSVSQYDAAICRVKLEHDTDGIMPFRYDKSEIELKALAPGETSVVFQCGGKTFTVYVVVK